MVLVRAKKGMSLALVPNHLTAAQVDGAFKEIGISPSQVYQVSDWKPAAVGGAAAMSPYRPR